MSIDDDLELQADRLLAAVFPTPVERALGWVACAAFKVGVAADELRCLLSRRRADRSHL